MFKRAFVAAVGVGLAAALAWAVPTSVSGTFNKGPALGGRVKVRQNSIITIKDESAVGNLFGGVLTGQAAYSTKKEVVDMATGTGSFTIDVQITNGKGSIIDATLDGQTTGVTPTAVMVSVSGTWRIKHVSGPDAGLKGEGTFFGSENFETGETQGNFSGAVQ